MSLTDQLGDSVPPAPSGPRSKRKGIRGLYKRGRIWWMAYTVKTYDADGTVIKSDTLQRSTGKTKMADAEKILDAIKRDINTGHYIPEAKRVTALPHPWEIVCDSYLGDRTLRGKRTDSYKKLILWRAAFAGRDVATVTLDEIEAKLAAWKDDRKWSPATYNNALAAVSGVFSYAYRKGWVDRHPLRGRAERLPVSNARERYFLPFEIAALRAGSPAWLSDAILGAAITGLRRGNFFALTVGDVVKDESGDLYLHVGREKNGEPIRKRVTGELRTIVERRMKGRTPAAFLFPGPDDGDATHTVAAYLRVAVEDVARKHPDWKLRWGIKDDGVTFHSLRHSFASLALNAGVAMDVVQKMGGWKTASQVRVYARRAEESIREGEDRLAEILSLDTTVQSRKTDEATAAIEAS
jgi:integrase